MPFNRPTLTQLLDRAAADIESRLPGTDARLRRAILNVIARVQAGSINGLYGRLDYLADQLMVDTCEAEYLDRWASIWKVTRKAAVQAKGTATITGTAGVAIPAGSTLQRSDGAQFTTDALATIGVGGSVSTAITAVTGGTAGNTAANTQLAFASPIAGANNAATVDAAGLTGGTDTETDAELRTRLLDRIQQPPQGGASGDYVQWALAVAGVTRAWDYPAELGPGTVSVRFMTDDLTVDGIPAAGSVTAVQSAIDAVRPVTANVTVVAPVAAPLNLTITGLTPNNATVQAAVQASVADLLRQEATPGGTILLSHLREAIALAAGVTDYTLTSPAADVAHTTGQIATMGTITWA